MSVLYPLVTFSFQVDFGGTVIGFTEVSGLDFETEVVEYRSGASPNFSKIKMPGQQKFANLSLKRGTFLNNYEFYQWWDSVQLNTIQRRTVTITLLNELRVPVVTWVAENAWPTKVQSTGLKADGSEVAIESMELVIESLSIQTS
ncbi:MAG: phage tail-like protein [Crocinitomicaceae bacterium]|jgi:phage tail-like protein